MNDDILITLVEKYEELYNPKHQNYHNQLRRDNIWDEIGQIINESGKICKDRWTKIRDNHRKALQLRKTKTGQAASKMKPPKYNKELSFLLPYLQLDENLGTNIQSHADLTEQLSPNSPQSSVVSPYASPECDPLDHQDYSGQIGTRRARSRNFDDTSRASVMKEYLESRHDNYYRETQSSDEKDPLIGFFINMARTVKGFPIDQQIKLKNEIFTLVNNAELKLAMQARETEQTTVIISKPQIIASTSSHKRTHKAVQNNTELLSQVIKTECKSTSCDPE